MRKEKLLNISNKYIYFRKILEKFNFRIVVNANPNGRRAVEKGELCKRSNGNDVDLNRNWNYNWNKNIGLPTEENPGDKPFSEVETLFVHDSLKNFKADIFLSVHSGVYGLFIPYAFNKKECKKNNAAMKTVLNKIKHKFCSVCQLGSPALLIGYKSSGTCLDYAFKKLNVPYAFAWEIYTNEIALPDMEEKLKFNTNSSFLEEKAEFMDKNSIKNYSKNYSEFKKELLSGRKTIFTEEENEICFALFNPLDKQHYDYILNNWAGV